MASTVWQDGYLKSETSPTGVVHTREYNSQGLLESVTQGTTNAKESFTYYSGTSNVHVATKTTGMPDQLIAERLLLEIAGRARRLGL